MSFTPSRSSPHGVGQPVICFVPDPRGCDYAFPRRAPPCSLSPTAVPGRPRACVMYWLLLLSPPPLLCCCCSRSSPDGVSQPAICSVAEPRGSGYLFYLFYFFTLTFTFQLLDKPWSQVSPPFPPRYALSLSSSRGFSITNARRLSSNLTSMRSRAFRSPNSDARKSPYEHEHAPGETRPQKLPLVGTRFTYRPSTTK